MAYKLGFLTVSSTHWSYKPPTSSLLVFQCGIITVMCNVVCLLSLKDTAFIR